MHAQTPEAELARQAVIGARAARRVEVDIVTHTPAPWRRADLADVPSAARAFAQAAQRAGLEVAARMAGDRAVQVGVARDGMLWMRATWSRTERGALTSKGVKVGDELLNITDARARWVDAIGGTS